MTHRLLYIEDNLDNQFLIGLWFKKSRFELTVCGTAEEALAKVGSEPAFDAIILDVNLPGDLSGADFLKQLRMNTANLGVPVIMVSGHSSIDHIPGLSPSNYQFFLSKPFRKHELMDILNSLFPASAD